MSTSSDFNTPVQRKRRSDDTLLGEIESKRTRPDEIADGPLRRSARIASLQRSVVATTDVLSDLFEDMSIDTAGYDAINDESDSGKHNYISFLCFLFKSVYNIFIFITLKVQT